MTTVTVTSGTDCDVEVTVDLPADGPTVAVDLDPALVAVAVDICLPEP